MHNRHSHSVIAKQLKMYRKYLPLSYWGIGSSNFTLSHIHQTSSKRLCAIVGKHINFLHIKVHLLNGVENIVAKGDIAGLIMIWKSVSFASQKIRQSKVWLFITINDKLVKMWVRAWCVTGWLLCHTLIVWGCNVVVNIVSCVCWLSHTSSLSKKLSAHPSSLIGHLWEKECVCRRLIQIYENPSNIY